MHDTLVATEIVKKAEDALSRATAPDRARLDEILARAEELRGLPLFDAASLLLVDDPEWLRLMYASAGRVKEAVFGPRVVLFAPLYLSNLCANDCLYCGFRRSNLSAARKALSPPDAVEQARILSARGFKRLLLVAGEHPGRYGVDYLVEVAHAIYSATDIRILHVNCAPLSVEEFRRLKRAGYGVYQCFQETYDRVAYAELHPSGRKKDYEYRLTAMDRALEAGFGDVGIGALFGLSDYRYDTLAAIAHSQHLEERFGAAAHTISVPRMRPAKGAALSTPPHPVDDGAFKKIVAVYRLSVPYAGIVISTRERAKLREEVLGIGASQISAGSSTEPGGYDEHEHSQTQFDVSDVRGLSEMAAVIARKGYLPSFCTSCYRSGRQGDQFRKVAASGAMSDFCTPNAILSLKEYIVDNATEKTKALLEETLKNFLGDLEEPLRTDLEKKLARIEKGERDIHY